MSDIEELEQEYKALLQEKINELKAEKEAKEKAEKEAQLKAEKEKEKEELFEEFAKKFGIKAESKLKEETRLTSAPISRIGSTFVNLSLDEALERTKDTFAKRVERETGKKINYRSYEEILQDMQAGVF